MTQPFAPMLAVDAKPFDSPDHLFEIKWDGVRCLAAVESKALHLWGRGLADYTYRYPELDELRQFPPDTVFDGEIVRLGAGRADFSAVLRRHQLTSPRKIRWAASRQPVTYIVFDLLKLKGRCLLPEPLRQRRARLSELLATAGSQHIVFSAGVVGRGRSFFDGAIEQQHEGVMAKHLDSRYQLGKRTSAWRKIKPCCELACVVIGYSVNKDRSLRRLYLAAEHQGTLRYVGCVDRGLTTAIRHRLASLLQIRRCSKPVVPCGEHAQWVRPDLYCRVKSFGWSPSQRLRFPSFLGLLAPES